MGSIIDFIQDKVKFSADLVRCLGEKVHIHIHGGESFDIHLWMRFLQNHTNYATSKTTKMETRFLREFLLS